MIFALALGLNLFAHARSCTHVEFTRELSALQNVLPAPPCRLPKRADPLEIVLIGENHHSIPAQQIRSLGVRRGTAGEVAFLSETSNEGALFPADPAPRSTLIGLESNAGLSLLIAYETRDPRNDYDVQRATSILRKFLPRSPLLTEALRRVAPHRPVDEALPETDSPEARSLISALATEVFRLAGTKYAAQLDGSAWPDEAYNANNPNWETLHGRILALRDRDFARTAGHEICGLARTFRRIFINVGDAHAGEMRHYLETNFGAAVNIRYLDESNPDDAQTALRLLRE